MPPCGHVCQALANYSGDYKAEFKAMNSGVDGAQDGVVMLIEVRPEGGRGAFVGGRGR